MKQKKVGEKRGVKDHSSEEDNWKSASNVRRGNCQGLGWGDKTCKNYSKKGASHHPLIIPVRNSPLKNPYFRGKAGEKKFADMREKKD